VLLNDIASASAIPRARGADKMMQALRDQVVLNQLFCSVFRPSLLDQADDQQEDGESENADSMDEIDDPMGGKIVFM